MSMLMNNHDDVGLKDAIKMAVSGIYLLSVFLVLKKNPRGTEHI